MPKFVEAEDLTPGERFRFLHSEHVWVCTKQVPPTREKSGFRRADGVLDYARDFDQSPDVVPIVMSYGQHLQTIGERPSPHA